MDFPKTDGEDLIRVRSLKALWHIELNRPQVLNSLSLAMVRQLAQVLDAAQQNPQVRCLLITGSGPKAFCAGGDIKWVALQVRSENRAEAKAFFHEEYALDLAVHRSSKPVVVVAHGVTMGGGLGLAAGADIVLATETTHMAMPETRIGFFPDVGSTGWLYAKCPAGYPEYLALTGDSVLGFHAVRVGLATHAVESYRLPDVLRALQDAAPALTPERTTAQKELFELMASFTRSEAIPVDAAMDTWVRSYFDGVSSVPELLKNLSQCQTQSRLCEGVFRRLSERSPTAVALTLALLKVQRGRPIEEVLAMDERVARWIIQHHDFWEGVRARLIDKDNRPRWDPARYEEVRSFGPLDPFLQNPPEQEQARRPIK